MRKLEEVQWDYSRAAMELGDIEFKKQLAEDNLNNLDHNATKLKNKMENLAKEARNISEAIKAEVTLPVEPKKEESDVRS